MDIHVNINDSFLFSRLLVIIDIDIVCVFVQNGSTALMFASEVGKLDIVQALLLGGADINIQNEVKSHSHIDIGVVPHESQSVTV